jgi:hypothetical protein
LDIPKLGNLGFLWIAPWILSLKTHGKHCRAVNVRILFVVFLQICESLQSNDWKVEHPNPNAMGPYAYKGNQWVGYDDINIVKLKVRHCYLKM